ncbi:hypothetical protein KI387_020313, partial [Taxus chinensis]
MLSAARASMLSQLHRNSGHGFDSPRQILFISARPNSKLFIAIKNERLHSIRRIGFHATSSETDIITSSEDEGWKPEAGGNKAEEEYEVELDKPYGLRFYKGSDGGTYIDAIAPGCSAAKTEMFSVGDKVISTSAVFGTEIWPAAEYGRTMYTIRQRVGPLYMKMQKRY